MALKLPPKKELRPETRTICNYIEIERTTIGTQIIKERLVSSKCWVKDLKKKVKPRKKNTTIVIEEEGEM